ncbi:hypothetical protein EDD92_9349 [Streptomyces sp. TLI_185]|nr:hypothetical protein EDD92_9349 [Streptomyces sp. TLI_185]
MKRFGLRRSRAAPSRQRKSRTDWPRFTLAFLTAAALASGMIATTTATAIPVSIAVASNPFTVTARKLTATGATQFASFRQDIGGHDHPVAVVGIRDAEISGLCQSAVAHTPLGSATVIVRSDAEQPVRAQDMVLDLAEVTGDMTFQSVEMGRDASTLKSSGVTGPASTYGQQARTLTITGMRLKAWSLTAGLFSLSDATLSIKRGEQPCP